MSGIKINIFNVLGLVIIISILLLGIYGIINNSLPFFRDKPTKHIIRQINDSISTDSVFRTHFKNYSDSILKDINIKQNSYINSQQEIENKLDSLFIYKTTIHAKELDHIEYYTNDSITKFFTERYR